MPVSLEKIRSHIESEIPKLDFDGEPAQLYEPISYLLSLGGKRLRPALTFLSAALFGKYDDEARKQITPPALAVEVFHNFTLMHDDIMDEAPLRRGRATVHEKWSPHIALLSGDVMLVKAYELMMQVPDVKLRRVLNAFNKCAAGVCEGQQMDMNFETRQTVSVDEYLEMIKLKTSVLLGFALELGGILSDANEQECKALYELGIKAGIGFQLHDDLLDVFGDPEKFGKQVGGDIIANKKTYLLIKALESAEGSTLSRLQEQLRLTEFDASEKVNIVKEIYEELEIRKHTHTLIERFFGEAQTLLNGFKVPEAHKTPLQDFLDMLMQRTR